MLEHKSQKVIPFSHFLERLLRFFGIAFLLILMALGIGVTGYHWLGGLSWIDAFLNASMILGGMGPVDTLTTDSAKIFASFYALFSGLVFIAVIGIVFTPLAHRMLHRFHMEEKDL